ncbi:MAG: metal ABC transporter ATP-binding protein [Veillonella sp.]|uniref:metal ABC transporter ATP-binding protein n=1 Tax=Veillonella sp. TaxID=1926307 RepID=UPI0025E96D34|nr:metal ABC transporter ATP-binding protein [Veillonella sp.]MBS4913966.1 metal ABC transporter ATP-binding protein [Veillonella sp.]
MIEVKDVRFYYEQDEILCNISLTIKEGEFTIIVGPNGAGKTTCLRLLSGLLSPTEGTILIDGKTVKEAQTSGLLHLVPQIYNKNAAQFPATCLEIVELGLRTHKLSRKERHEAALDALSQVGMSDFKDRRIGELSGGQQQRVMIAQALARKPKYLLLDEPTSGIDFEASRHIMELLRTLCDKGMTIVMVTHDIEEGCKLADKAVCINRHICYQGDGDGFMETHKGSKLFWHIGG